MPDDRSVVGDLINFRGLVYAPINENGVVFLFGKVVEDLHMYVEEIKPGFPDCVARRFTGKGWERTRIEFEFRSSNFKQHGHDPDGCDVVVCWQHDWKDCPLEVIELKAFIAELDNPPMKQPGESDPRAASVDPVFEKRGTGDAARGWWTRIWDALVAHDPEVWMNVGTKAVGLYSPERSFATLRPQKSGLRFKCFTGGKPMKGVTVASERIAPRWGRFTVKGEDQIDVAVATLTDSQARIKAAIKAGENTSFYSGGERANRKAEEDEDEAEDEGKG